MTIETVEITQTDDHVAEPPMFRVILLNDDYTTMDFVVYILETVFKKSPTEAVHIMYMVHEQGSGVCGVYTAEIAETKIDRVHELAENAGFPLKAVMEPA